MSQEKLIFKSNETEQSIQSTKSYFKNEIFDVSTFNYEGDCGKYFKYKNNNKRDVVISVLSIYSQNSYNKENFITTLNITRNGVPNARYILLMLTPPPELSTFEEDMKQLGIELVYIKKVPPGHAVVVRYVVEQQFIKEHIDEFDRIVVCDIGDVMLFNDFFATFSSEEMHWLTECYNPSDMSQCWGPSTYGRHYKWMASFFGESVAKTFKEQKYPAVNGGFGFGGSQKMLETLTILVNRMDKKSMKSWGYDQALLNYLYYNGEFNSTGFSISTCTQQLCYHTHLCAHLKRRTIYFNNTLCSPIAIHKLLMDNSKYRLK